MKLLQKSKAVEQNVEEKSPTAETNKKGKKEKQKKPINKRKVFGITSIVIAFFIAFFATPMLTKITNEEMITIVQTSTDIKKGTKIEDKHIETKTVPKKGIHNSVIMDVQAVLGKYANVDMIKNDTVYKEKITEQFPLPDEYLYNLPAGKQAMSIRISAIENGLSGKLQQNDIVGVYANIDKQEDTYLAVAPSELRYVRVLSVTTETGADYRKDKEEEKDKEEILPVTVELLVNDRQAQALAGLNGQGNIHLSLISRGNEEYSAQLLELQDKLLQQLEVVK